MHARDDMEDAERELAGTTAPTAEGTTQADASEIRRALPQGAALVSFVQYDRATSGSATPQLAVPSPSYAALILRSDAEEVVAVRLPTVAELAPILQAWRRDTSRPTPSAPSTQDHWRTSGNRLRRALWDPIARHLQGARRVFIVPDGALSLVAFEGLPNPSASFVLETLAPIHYLTAERDVLLPGHSVGPGRRLLAVGGPTFDRLRDPVVTSPPTTPGQNVAEQAAAASRAGRAPCETFESPQFAPLPGTDAEVNDVARLWSSGLEAAGLSAEKQVLTGPEATERAVKAEAGGADVIHLATHGVFLGEPCEAIPTGTRGVGGLTAAQQSAAENPLRLSGLAFAGANRRNQAGRDTDDDGILTAEEVAMMNLQGVEWAVLSACDTGVGEVRAGEGVFGLRRAFQIAGARTVIMSLWSVDDLATRTWMRALYEGRFQRNLSTADAVHQASLTVLRDRRARGLSTHPFYWAAFVAAGDWR